MSKSYIIRLDDAAPKRNKVNWDRIEDLLDKYGIKPLVGIIPDCQDPDMEKYSEDNSFWDRTNEWQKKGWVLALHGYHHIFLTREGGINPVNSKSEFAGVPLEKQKEMIREGVKILRQHGIEPKVFFAPAHTFDMNTIDALKSESNIRVISDTIANDSYGAYGMTFVPQQSGHVRKLPLKLTTFCYHPNGMSDDDFDELEKFISNNKEYFEKFPASKSHRSKTVYDNILNKVYFLRRK